MSPSLRNRIFASLRPAAQDFMRKHALTRETRAGEVLYLEGAEFTHAVFPHSGIISLIAASSDGRQVEKAAIGPEGFLGFELILGGASGSIAMSRSVVQVPGYASWISIRDIDEALNEFICVRETMLRYARSLITQTMETVACNSLHSADQRVARWLMNADDSNEGETFTLTQQALADVLGLRRATVSTACAKLQIAGAIEYSRGTIRVLDRRELERHSCDCYFKIKQAALPTMTTY